MISVHRDYKGIEKIAPLKTLKPGGLPASFYQRYWDILGPKHGGSASLLSVRANLELCALKLPNLDLGYHRLWLTISRTSSLRRIRMLKS
ncbi:hypothetical protein ACOSQ3_019521 [Xanthoceras sorbifolium]